MGALLDLLVPSCCDGCGRPAPPPWCASCDEERRERAPAEPCWSCAGEAGAGHACWAPPAPVDALVALGAWTGGTARAVTRAKLAGRREVLVAAGRALGTAVRARGAVVDVVVPVPADRDRVRRRGRDHTAALAAGVGTAVAAPVVQPFAPVRGSSDLTGRGGRRATDRHTGASYRLVPGAAIEGRVVLLVDDVVTTGATLAAVVAAIVVGGPAGVLAAVVGRAGRHRLGVSDAAP